jgi:hypothetical protein
VKINIRLDQSECMKNAEKEYMGYKVSVASGSENV